MQIITFRLSGLFSRLGAVACVLLLLLVQSFADSSTALAGPKVTPFNGCTFYAPPYGAQSFAGGAPYAGCAEWSAIRGRNGCTKVKGVCPACVTYQGDSLQMWLPEYFIEVTTAPGESAFTEGADGGLLSKHLALGYTTWKTGTKAKLPIPTADRSMPDVTNQSTVWHARVLVMPYANMMGSYSPLPSVQGTEAPTCFAGLSEFVPEQWAFNAADVGYAAAWAPLGIPLCNMPEGALSMAALDAARTAVSRVAGSGSFGGGDGEVCARPVSGGEATKKNLRPSSDALAPLTEGPASLSSKLCMGAWGNLLPRTGWSVTADPLLSAMQAAYRFTSLAADVALNDRWKLKTDDKWQIVFPVNLPATCFKPGAPFPFLNVPPLEDPTRRNAHELNPKSKRKGTYIIAVWRRRETCQEPLETVGGWSASHKGNLLKNQAICQGFNAGRPWE